MADKTVTVRPSGQGGTYTTTAAAIAGELALNADLVAMDGLLNINQEGTWASADTQYVSISGFTTDIARHLSVVNLSDTYRLTVDRGWGTVLAISTNYTHVKNIICNNTNANGSGITVNATGCILDSVQNLHSAWEGIRVYSTSGCVLLNCVSKNAGIGIQCDWANTALYNCNTVNNSSHGISANNGSCTITAKNCYSGGNGGNDYNVTTGSTLTTTTCFSDDGTQSTSTAPYSTATFTNVTPGSENFALPAGSTLRQVGTDLSADATYPFNWDMAGRIRDGYWDVGANRGVGDKIVTVMPSGQGGTYTTTAAAISGEVVRNPSLVNMNGRLRVIPSGNWSGVVDTAPVVVTGFTTDITRYVDIEADAANRANGAYDSARYTFGAYEANIAIRTQYTRLSGIQIRNSIGVGSLISVEVFNVTIDSNLITNCDGENGILSRYRTIVSNNVITNSNFVRCISDRWGDEPTLSMLCVNNVVCGNTGIGIYGMRGQTPQTTYGRYINNYSGGNTGANYDLDGTFTLINCYSSDGIEGTLIAPYTTATFTSVTPGSENFAPASGSTLLGAGTNLSADSVYPFNWDMAGNTRPTSWSVGAMEATAAPDYLVILTTLPISVTPGSPTIMQPRVVSLGTLPVALTPGSPTIAQPRVVSLGTLPVALTPGSPTIRQPRVVALSALPVALTPGSPIIRQAWLVSLSAIPVALTPGSPTIRQSQRVAVSTLPLVMTPGSIDISPTQRVTLSPLSLLLSPGSLDVRQAQRVTPSALNIGINPANLTIGQPRLISIDGIPVGVTLGDLEIEQITDVNRVVPSGLQCYARLEPVIIRQTQSVSLSTIVAQVLLGNLVINLPIYDLPPKSRTVVLESSPGAYIVVLPANPRLIVLPVNKEGMMPIYTESKDPSDTIDYALDWRKHLLPLEAIVTNEWSSDRPGITIHTTAPRAPYISGTKTAVWLSGGESGVLYTLTNRITTDNVPPRTLERSVQLMVVER